MQGISILREDIEEELILLIAQVFHGIIDMGNKRSAGYGACKCISTEIKEGMPYEKLRNKQISEYIFPCSSFRYGDGE